MDANNEFDKLIKDKLAKGTQQVPSELKAAIESRLVKEGLIKKDQVITGNGFSFPFLLLQYLLFLQAGIIMSTRLQLLSRDLQRLNQMRFQCWPVVQKYRIKDYG